MGGGGTLRVEYEYLDAIAKKFSFMAQETQKVYQKLKHDVEHLHSTDWRGRAADKWFEEMENLLLPKTLHLCHLLEEIVHLLKKVSSAYRAAEHDAAALFKQKP